MVIEKVFKEIFLDKPRITRFDIDWESKEERGERGHSQERESIAKDVEYSEMMSEMAAIKKERHNSALDRP